MSYPAPVVTRAGSDDSAAPVVILFHGRGFDETSMLEIVPRLPVGPQYLALRGPLPVDDGWTWFDNRGLGRPIPESLAETVAWFRAWLDESTIPECPVVLLGFSGGAAFAAAVALTDPGRYRGLGMLHGTVPWDAGIPTEPGGLCGLGLFCGMGEKDDVMPAELMERTWQYLDGPAGARCSWMRKDPGGHELTPDMLAEVNRWLVNGLSGC